MRSVEPDILCEDLVRIYNTEGVEVQALQGLNLRVDPGEIVAIVGASGSGKSTLLSILSGLDRPTGGRAWVAGYDLSSLSGQQRLIFQRTQVGFVWQQTSQNLLPYLTAVENVEVPMALASRGGPDGEPRREHALALLDALGIADKADRMPNELSGGQQQRVATAVALANTPRVLLADEPTGALDQATSEDLLELMRATSEALGVTMLVVTHDPTVSEHVRRTIQIRDGRTSTETIRRAGADGDMSDAEEFTVIDRAGRLQLPEHFVKDLSLKDRVRLHLAADHAEVFPEDAVTPSSPSDATESSLSDERSEAESKDGENVMPRDAGAERPLSRRELRELREKEAHND